MRVRMGSQGPLTPCPAPSGRRSPPRDQKEGAGAARPADRPSFSGLVGGAAAVGDSSSSSATGPRARPTWRCAHQGGVERGSARPGMGRVGMRSLWEDVVAVAELLGAPWLLLQAGGGSVALRVPLWPLMGSLAAGMGPRGRFRASCGRLGAPGVRARPPCAFHRLRASHQPAVVWDPRRTSDDRRSKKGSKKQGRELAVHVGGRAVVAVSVAQLEQDEARSLAGHDAAYGDRDQ